MRKVTIFIIKTGVANTASVIAAFAKLGIEAKLTSNPLEIMREAFVVLPGVGAFGAGMSCLVESGLLDAITNRVENQKSTLAICLGLQLLAKSSEESVGVCGLGILDAPVTKFSDPLRVPHFGWNEVKASSGSRFIEDGYAYFANSYRISQLHDPWVCSTCIYGDPFVAAVEKGNFLGCQFHPELSGKWGQELLFRWVNFKC